jgi:T-complex protein 1 subunit theta
MLQSGSGFQGMLKEGARHYAGLEEAILRNIDACVQISKITRTSLGPMGMNKIVVTDLDKVYITSDAATLMEEMEVHHPAAKMLAMAAKTQESEVGDGTNFVLVFAGELLSQAEGLLKMGLHPSEILIGYEKAYKKCIEIAPKYVVYTINDVRKKEEVIPCLQNVVATKLYGYENVLAPLVFDACNHAMPKDVHNFDVENVRVAKIMGPSINDSTLVRGLVIVRGAETSHTYVKDAKVAIFNCPLEAGTGETKGTVLLKSADELQNYTKTEEKHMEDFIKSVADAGVNVVIAGGNVSDVALHFLEKYNIMVIKIMSKFELRRVAKATGATFLVRYVFSANFIYNIGCPNS